VVREAGDQRRFGPGISNETRAHPLGFAQLRFGTSALDQAPEQRVRVNAVYVLTACPAFASGWKIGALVLAFFATDELVVAAEFPGDVVGTAVSGVK
jgi:hypothetical protein